MTREHRSTGTGPASGEVSPGPADAMPAGFGLATSTFVVVSSMVGVGVLTTSGHTVALLGSNALMLGLWAVGGGIALCGALSLAELAAMLPRSGGEYVFLREAFGPRMAFLAGWSSLLLGFAAPIAAASWAASAYLLAPLGLSGRGEGWSRLALASAEILTFAAVHASARRRTVRAQGLVTGLEVVVLVAFVACGVVAGRGNFARLDDLPKAELRLVPDLFFSLIYIAYGYTGWNAVAYLAGEVSEPRRRLPRAILIGTVGVTVLYLGMNLVYALALSAEDVREIARAGGARAVEPIAERAALALFGPAWAGRFSVALGLILLATTSAYLLTGPRVVFAMARAGQFPSLAGRLSGRGETPRVATAIVAGLALVILWTGSFEAIVVFAGVGLAISSMLSVGSVYALRVRRPDLPRPFRVPGYPVIPAVYLVGTGGTIVAAFWREPLVSCLSAASLLAALPLYEVWTRRRRLASGGGGDTLVELCDGT